VLVTWEQNIFRLQQKTHSFFMRWNFGHVLVRFKIIQGDQKVCVTDYSTKNMQKYFKQFQSLTVIWRWPSQNTFGMWTVLYWKRSSGTQFSVSINVWRLVGDTLNITRNFLYSNHQVHRDFLITLYKSNHQFSTLHAVGLYWVPGHTGVRGNEISNGLARGGSGLRFVGPEPTLGVSRQDIRRKIWHRLVNQHWAWWWGLGNTQRQASELISGPCLCAKARFCPLTGHNPGLLLAFLLGIIPWEDMFT
jgi:hypothetical protein